MAGTIYVRYASGSLEFSYSVSMNKVNRVKQDLSNGINYILLERDVDGFTGRDTFIPIQNVALVELFEDAVA